MKIAWAPGPGSLEAGRERQPSRALVGEHQFTEARLVDRDAALAQACDFVRIHFDADDFMTEVREAGPETRPT